MLSLQDWTEHISIIYSVFLIEQLDQLLLNPVTLTPLEALHHLNTLMLVFLPAGQKSYGLKAGLYL